MRSVALSLISLACFLQSSSTHAETLADAEVSRRLAFIETRLARGTSRANLWWNSCYYGWTALTAGQFVIAIATSDKGTRTDMAVGAAASTLALIPLGILPFPARSAWRNLSRVPGDSSEQRRRKLVFAEHLLESAAKDEKLRRSWVNHATSIGVSAAVGVLLGVGYGRPTSGLLNALGGIALSEIQIWTTPTAAIGDFAEYQSFRDNPQALGHPVSSAAMAPRLTLSLAPYFGGVSVVGSF